MCIKIEKIPAVWIKSNWFAINYSSSHHRGSASKQISLQTSVISTSMTMAHGILASFWDTAYTLKEQQFSTIKTATYQITCQRWCLQIALREKLHNDDEVPGKKSWEWSRVMMMTIVFLSMCHQRSKVFHDSLVSVVSSNLYSFATQITAFHLTFKKSSTKTFLIAKELTQNEFFWLVVYFSQQKLLMFDTDLSINWRYHSKFCLKSHESTTVTK